MANDNPKLFNEIMYDGVLGNKPAAMDKFEKSEVSKMEWNSYEECLIKIRPYNLEKKRLITNIHNTLTQFRVLGY